MKRKRKSLQILGRKHSAVSRDYLARVNDETFPKARAAALAKEWGYDYWDGDRRVNYGGYSYIPGLWSPIAQALIDEYQLSESSRILDIGCGKGFLLAELKALMPAITVTGIDVSQYALDHAHPDVANSLLLGSATELPFQDLSFDLALSLNTLHNLYCYELDSALKEIERVADRKFIVVESYRNEVEKANLLYWQVTCEAFNTPEEWEWWFDYTGYSGDWELIFFE